MRSVTVLIVSDYAGGQEKSWNDLRVALAAWREQDYQDSVDYVLVESSRDAERIPADLFEILPALRVETADADTSYELKNFGVARATTDIVAIVDADCVPTPTWLRVMMRTFAAHPDAAAVSGLTTYPARSMMERVLGLLSRSYLDPGRAATTRFISGNAAGFIRARYLAHPLPEGLGAYASRIQSEAIRHDGGVFYFEPEMQVVHDFEGWPMEKDHRRNTGYSTIVTRLVDASLPYAWLVRRGPVAIPVISLGKTINSLGDCLRCAHHYRVRWFELPIALLFAVVIQFLEVPGMLAAYRGQRVGVTQYR